MAPSNPQPIAILNIPAFLAAICRSWALLLAAALAAGATPAGMHPVVYGDMLLGGVMNGRVVDATAMAGAVTGAERYRCYRNHVYRRMATGGKATESGSQNLLYTIALQGKGDCDIAICGTWNAVPRKPAAITPTAADRTAVLAMLRAHGLKRPKVHVTADYAVDLDGNGTVEHVICATTPNAAFQPQGLGASTIIKDDYSLVMIRTSVKGIAKSILVEGQFYPHVRRYDIAQAYTLKHLYDVDGDGKLEILVDFLNSEEFWGTTVYRFTGAGAITTPLACADAP